MQEDKPSFFDSSSRTFPTNAETLITLPQIVGPPTGLSSVTVAAGISFCVSLALTPLAIAVLGRRGIVDRPNSRSSHVRQTVQGGGIAPAVSSPSGRSAPIAAEPVQRLVQDKALDISAARRDRGSTPSSSEDGIPAEASMHNG